MAKKRMFIYKIKCLPTDKIYIGRTVKTPYRRLKEHFSDSNYKLNNCPLCQDMKIYQKEDFIVETLCEFYCENYQKADQLELSFIIENNSFYPNGYNVRRIKNGKKKND